MRKLSLVAAVALAATPLQVSWADSPAFLSSNDVDNILPTPNLPAEDLRPNLPETQLPAPQHQPLPMDTLIPVQGVLIEGGSVYPFAEIAELFNPLVGRTVSLREVLAITTQVTQRYQDDGYALSYAFIPAQDLRDGQLRVVLVEGYVATHQVEGEVGQVEAYIARLAGKLMQERPLRRESFERYTTLMAQIPGVSVRASVDPPTTTDGAATLVTRAQRRPFAASANFTKDNRDDLQAIFSVTSNSHTAWGEQVTASVLAPPGKDHEQYLRLDYSQYVNSEGTRFQTFASRYRSDPDQLVNIGAARTELSRSNDRLSLGVMHPFRVSPREMLTGTARLYGVDDKRDYTRLSPLPIIKDAVELHSKVRVAALESEWRQLEGQRLRVLGGGLYQGIDGLGAKSELRVLGVQGDSFHDLDFTRLRLNALQSDSFAGNWQGVVSAAAYWSDDHLPESEQVVFGDRNFGRGYPSDQAYGDKGWGLAYELSYSFRRDGPWVRLLQPYAAVDTARSWFNGNGPSSELASAALGVRFGDRRFYNLSLEAARPLADKAIDSRDRSPRYGVSLSYNL